MQTKNDRLEKTIGQIQKRDGRMETFQCEKIVKVLLKAFKQSKEHENDLATATRLAYSVMRELARVSKEMKVVPTVEGCQDEVERQLIKANLAETAKHYILYRNERAMLRAARREVPDIIRTMHDEGLRYFKDDVLGYFVYLRTYAKWLDSEGRRECWLETVDRYMSFMRKKLGNLLTEDEYSEIHGAILRQEVMPSMRLLQFAGEVAERDNVCAFNCSFTAPIALRHFAEILYLSMMGVGVGGASEAFNVEQLPQISKQSGEKLPTFVIPDSKEGWCDALLHGLVTWYSGKDVDFDYDLIRPEGARLKTMGGRASGPEPLRQLLNSTREKVISRQNRRLRAIDVLDITTKEGSCAVAGGVRRTAMINLSDLDDLELRYAKSGYELDNNPHRYVANNSAVYDEKPTALELLEEMTALIKGRSGERGIFNRGGSFKTMPERRLKYLKKRFRGKYIQLGTNPCGEILLLPFEFCNLSEAIGREADTVATLRWKIRIAAILGTYQSMLTDFTYISEEWKRNCEEERLLGVSVTGQWDCEAFRHVDVMRDLKELAISTNVEYAGRFGINESLSVTATKPSGTVSKTLNCSPGLHVRPAPFYIQRIRIAATDPLFHMMRDQGVPNHPEVGQQRDTANTFVLEFPVKSPQGSKYAADVTAIEQLDYWKMVKVNYTEHNPSATVYVGDDEWIGVCNWLFENWDIVGGLTFLPRSNHVYQLAPQEPVSEERYNQLAAAFPRIDFSQLYLYETEDTSDMKRELACAGGACTQD